MSNPPGITESKKGLIGLQMSHTVNLDRVSRFDLWPVCSPGQRYTADAIDHLAARWIDQARGEAVVDGAKSGFEVILRVKSASIHRTVYVACS